MSAIMLNPTGAVLGLIEESIYGETSLELEENDLLVMYTDGVIEAKNSYNDMFGSERLVDVITQMYDNPSRDIVRGIKENIESFVQGKTLADDTTVVIIRMT